MAHLTHGWEPELDAGDSLLRQFVLAFAERNETMADLDGGRSVRTDVFAAADAASPVFFDNAAVLLQPPEYTDVSAAVRGILAVYPPERHFVLLSVFPTPDLSPYGLRLMGHPPFMVRPAGGTAPPVPDGLEIRAVDDVRALQHFVATLVEGYPMPGGEGTALADGRILGRSMHFYVGYVDGEPVATAGAHVGHGVNDVEWVSTRPEHRRRGFGAAVTWAATLADPSLPAVLIASDDGQPVYEAMGYIRLMRLTMWHRPPAG